MERVRKLITPCKDPLKMRRLPRLLRRIMGDMIERLRNPPCGEQWTNGGLFDEAADEIERLTANKQTNAQIQWDAACEVYRAEIERLNAEVGRLFGEQYGMADWCEIGRNAQPEIERLTAELTHHKGKAEVWEDAARAAQARVDALEGVVDAAVAWGFTYNEPEEIALIKAIGVYRAATEQENK